MEAYDQDDLNNAILCLWKEARGDGYTAMNAVAHVIFNRVGAPGFPSNRRDVIYGKNQFSSMSISTDPEYNLAAPGVTDPQYPSYSEDAAAWPYSRKAPVLGTSGEKRTRRPRLT